MGLLQSKPQELKPIEAIQDFQISIFLGTWYQIAYLPNFFQAPNAIDVTATYSTNEDGSVNVLNKEYVDCQLNEIVGTASRAGTENQGEFLVSFFPGAPPGNYWILYMDARCMFVSEPSKQTAWFLARHPAIYQFELDYAMQFFAERGITGMQMTKHSYGR